jgi:hypothetical protein
MKQMNKRLLKTILILSAWLASIPAWSGNLVHLKQVKVVLLGQPCLLQGPYPEEVLLNVHSIGPAQLYSNLSIESSGNFSQESYDKSYKDTLQNLKKSLQKIRSNIHFPNDLDPYREKLGKRFEAQIAFFEAVVESSNKGPHQKSFTESLSKTAKQYLRAGSIDKFNSLFKKIENTHKNGTLLGKILPKTLIEMTSELFDFYNDNIEPDPESEFHRAVKKMHIEYRCSFEET